MIGWTGGKGVDVVLNSLTGEYATDVSDASGMLLLDVAKRNWSTELLSALELDIGLFGKCHESDDVTGRLTPAAANPAAALQSVVLQILLVALVPLAFLHLLKLDKRTALSLRPVTARNLFWCVLLALSVLFLLDEIVYWQEQLTGVRASLSPEIQKLLRADSPLQLVWIFFALALIPAICEELLFRGFILGRFLETGQPGQSLMMTSLLFGLFHRNLPALLPATLAGIMLAFAVSSTAE